MSRFSFMEEQLAVADDHWVYGEAEFVNEAVREQRLSQAAVAVDDEVPSLVDA